MTILLWRESDKFPPHNQATELIDDYRQIEPTLGSGNVGDIADQMLAGSLRRACVRKQVGRRQPPRDRAWLSWDEMDVEAWLADHYCA